MRSYEIIGLMSGTSMDGLDIAHVRFEVNKNGEWNFLIINSETIEYQTEFVDQLSKATTLSVPDFLKLDKKIGSTFGEMTLNFIDKYKINKSVIDAISSHGHTTFHQPENGFTSQIGCGSTISFITEIPVINDFRTKDVIAGGQGAPLVPIGDLLLFKNQAKSFLNLGGIANISFLQNNEMIAFDICPANLPLNKLVNNLGFDYDKNGDISRKGNINQELLSKLNELDYYKQNHPKSLGTEWLESIFNPLINFKSDIENTLRTIIEHEALEIASILNQNKLESVFISGGGTKNSFLIERIKYYFKGEIIIPDNRIIEFKEAIIFAFLGALYLEKQTNTISSVTGAFRNVVGGVYHIPN